MPETQRWYSPGLELRQATGTPSRLMGYAAVFDRPSLDLGGFIEVIRPGAFRRTLREWPDVRAFYGHNQENILGRQSNDTLSLTEDAHGLRAEITLPKTHVADDVRENVLNGNLDGMSFAFRLYDDQTGQRWDLRSQPARREILEAQVFEVSVVSMPAYPDTSVAVRAYQSVRGARVIDLEARLKARQLTWQARVR